MTPSPLSSHKCPSKRVFHHSAPNLMGSTSSCKLKELNYPSSWREQQVINSVLKSLTPSSTPLNTKESLSTSPLPLLSRQALHLQWRERCHAHPQWNRPWNHLLKDRRKQMTKTVLPSKIHSAPQRKKLIVHASKASSPTKTERVSEERRSLLRHRRSNLVRTVLRIKVAQTTLACQRSLKRLLR